MPQNVETFRRNVSTEITAYLHPLQGRALLLTRLARLPLPIHRILYKKLLGDDPQLEHQVHRAKPSPQRGQM